MDISVTYYDFPEFFDGSTPMDVEDFDIHTVSFSGDNLEDALLHALESFGYLNRESYIKSGLEMKVDAIIHAAGLDERYNGINGDEKDFILYIQDDLGRYIFDDEKNASDWKATFRW